MIVLRTFSGPYFVEYPKDKSAVPDRSPKYLTDSLPNKIEFPGGVLKRCSKRNKSKVEFAIFSGKFLNSKAYGHIILSEHGRYPNRVTLGYIKTSQYLSNLTEENIKQILEAIIKVLKGVKKFKTLTVYDDGREWTWVCENMGFYQDSFWAVDGKGELGMSIKL